MFCSIVRACSSVTCYDLTNSVTVLLRAVWSGKWGKLLELEGKLSDSLHTHSLVSSNKETHRPWPLTLSSSAGKLLLAVLWYFVGHGSKSSNFSFLRFLIFLCTCFSNITSEIFVLLSFCFQGCFHMHAKDVTGSSSASSSEVLLVKGTHGW